MTKGLITGIALLITGLDCASQDEQVLHVNSEQFNELITNENTHIRFFSSTPAEDIEANNYASTGALTKTTGEVVFSVPLQGFEFEKRLMQKHFNNKNFLDTQEFPRARFTGKITNLDQVDFSTE